MFSLKGSHIVFFSQFSLRMSEVDAFVQLCGDRNTLLEWWFSKKKKVQEKNALKNSNQDQKSY